MPHFIYLFWQLYRRDIGSRYRGAGLGWLWAVLSPLLLLVVYTFVFSVVFEARWGQAQDDRTFFALNLFAGMILHGLLAETMSRSTAIFLQHANYVKRVLFPLWLLPLVVVGTALFHALIGTLVLLAAIGVLQGALAWQAVWLPLVLLPLVVFVAGLAWMLAGLGVYIRDLGQLMPMLTTVLLFTAPVFYPVSALPEAYQRWMLLNPLTAPIEMMRTLLFEGALPQPAAWLGALGGSLLVLALGWAVFVRLRRGFADVL